MRDIRVLIESYLKAYPNKMMQLATTAGDQPWCCTVYYAIDEDLNFYWLSLPDRRHSNEIANNPKTAGVIVKPHTPGDTVRGIQFEGCSKLLTGEEEILGANYYIQQLNADKTLVEDIRSGKNPHKLV